MAEYINLTFNILDLDFNLQLNYFLDFGKLKYTAQSLNVIHSKTSTILAHGNCMIF